MIHLTWTLSLQSIESVLGTATYQNNKVNQWTSSIVEQCLNQLTKLGKPFKYIGTWMSPGISLNGWHHLCHPLHPFSLRPSLPPSLIPPSHSSTIFLSQPFYLTNILPPSLSATRRLHPFSVFSSSLCTLPYYPLSFTFFDHLLVPTFLPSPSIYLTGILPPSLSATRRLLLLHTPVTSVIMQKNGAGLHTASSCYWDNSTDGECVTTSRKKPVRHEQKHFTAT